jgi:hypothetical protein
MLLRAIIEFILLVIVVVSLFILTSCGSYQVSTTNIKVEVNLSDLDKYFRIKCEQEESDDVENCVNLKVAEFLEYVLN